MLQDVLKQIDKGFHSFFSSDVGRLKGPSSRQKALRKRMAGGALGVLIAFYLLTFVIGYCAGNMLDFRFAQSNLQFLQCKSNVLNKRRRSA